jgi:nitroreductase
MTSAAESLYALLRARRSVRRFRPEPPPRALLEKLLEAAVTAPSASNKQPWRFLVVTSADRIARLAVEVREAVERIAGHVEPASAPAFRAYGDYFTRFESAPVVIVALHRALTLLTHLAQPTLPSADRARIAAMERDSGLMGTAMALENLLLAAPTLGLGASGMTGPLVAVDRIRALLEVPESWEVAALVPVGFPAEEPVPTERKGLGAVVRWIDGSRPGGGGE